MQPDIDEGTKVDHVEHGAEQLHANLEVVEFEHPLLEDRLRQILPRIATGAEELLENVGEKETTHPQLHRELVQVDATGPLGESGNRLTIGKGLGIRPEA